MKDYDTFQKDLGWIAQGPDKCKMFFNLEKFTVIQFGIKNTKYN